jgi:hypothetical protein
VRSISVGLGLVGNLVLGFSNLGLAVLLDRVGIRLGFRSLSIELVSSLSSLLLAIGDDIGSSLENIGGQASSLINIGSRLGLALLLSILCGAFCVGGGLVSLLFSNLDVADDASALSSTRSWYYLLDSGIEELAGETSSLVDESTNSLIGVTRQLLRGK